MKHLLITLALLISFSAFGQTLYNGDNINELVTDFKQRGTEPVNRDGLIYCLTTAGSQYRSEVREAKWPAERPLGSTYITGTRYVVHRLDPNIDGRIIIQQQHAAHNDPAAQYWIGAEEANNLQNNPDRELAIFVAPLQGRPGYWTRTGLILAAGTWDVITTFTVGNGSSQYPGLTEVRIGKDGEDYKVFTIQGRNVFSGNELGGSFKVGIYQRNNTKHTDLSLYFRLIENSNDWRLVDPRQDDEVQPPEVPNYPDTLRLKKSVIIMIWNGEKWINKTKTSTYK